MSAFSTDLPHTTHIVVVCLIVVVHVSVVEIHVPRVVCIVDVGRGRPKFGDYYQKIRSYRYGFLRL